MVHCSAGIGRSGTLVAIELCLMQLVAGNELVVSDMVTYIRQKRAQSVQTKEQYLYIFRFASSGLMLTEQSALSDSLQICHYHIVFSVPILFKSYHKYPILINRQSYKWKGKTQNTSTTQPFTFYKTLLLFFLKSF